ncbi:hypothetical protein PAEPH01_0181 [Pancytospora epiphaga]|nr:hypothetical protein PAEPH01_0181 [Pancytospora epiphaga]
MSTRSIRSTIFYFLFLLLHGVKQHPISITTLPSSTFLGKYEHLLFLYTFPLFSIGFPLSLLVFLLPELRIDNKLEYHYFFMLIASAVIYCVDILQDVFLQNCKWYAYHDRATKNLKYIIHLFITPMVYVDALYSIIVDKRRVTYKISAKSLSERMLIVIEDASILSYIGLSACIFWKYSRVPDIKTTFEKYRAYFALQMLICALTVLIVVKAGLYFCSIRYKSQV